MRYLKLGRDHWWLVSDGKCLEEILEKARLLKDTNFSEIGITPDLTREQRAEEDEMAKEAEKRNLERTEDERSKNVEWILVG